MRILAQIRFVRTADGVADVLELRQNQQCAVLDLLHGIRHAVGTMHLNFTGDFIHRELVVLQIEFAIRQSQTLNDAQLGRLLEIEIAGIVPAAHVHSRDVIAAFVLAVRCRSLIPAVELLADNGRQAAIVQVRGAVPYAVAFANGNVIHLHGDVMVQAVLPDVGVSVLVDGEGRRTLACVLNYVKAGVLYRGEVEFRIDVAQPGR